MDVAAKLLNELSLAPDWPIYVEFAGTRREDFVRFLAAKVYEKKGRCSKTCHCGSTCALLPGHEDVCRCIPWWMEAS